MIRILVVDDEAVILKFLGRVLEREGYTVYTAANGVEAQRVLTHFHIDLLLTDIKMNEMDGIALLHEARTRFPEMAIILLTGHATVESAVMALREGALNYLLKPVKNEDLVSAVRDALHQQDREKRRDQLESMAVHFAKALDYAAPTIHPNILEFQTLRLDKNAHRATIEGQPLALTPTEFRLLAALCETPGTALEYVQLVKAACGYFCERQTAREIIGAHVRNLRLKLSDCVMIEAVRGIGYRLTSATAEGEEIP